MVRLAVVGVKGGGAGSVAFELAEHLPHRHALDSILSLDQDRLVSPFGERRNGKTVA